MKERLTITLDKNVLHDVDNTIDGHTIKNRSHAIELLVNKALRKKTLTKAILLAGGVNTIGLGTAKQSVCCAKVSGRPLLVQIMYFLKKQGIEEFVIVGTKDVLKITEDYFKTANLDAEIEYILEPELSGTGGALKLAAEQVVGPVVVCNTNALFQLDLAEMFKFHKNSGSLATMALTSVPDVHNYGVVILNGSKIFSFEEKPTKKIPSNLINAGVYIIEPEVLDLMPEGYSRFEIDLFPKLARAENLSGFVFYGKWIHVETKDDLEDANKDW